jgi:hypothetical protein
MSDTSVREIAKLLQQLRIALDTNVIVMDGNREREVQSIAPAAGGYLVITLASVVPERKLPVW